MKEERKKGIKYFQLYAIIYGSYFDYLRNPIYLDTGL